MLNHRCAPKNLSWELKYQISKLSIKIFTLISYEKNIDSGEIVSFLKCLETKNVNTIYITTSQSRIQLSIY